MTDSMARISEAIASCLSVAPATDAAAPASDSAAAGAGAGAAPFMAELQVRSMQKSFLVSADMAHALHPNFPEKHDPELQPTLGAGVVIKHNTEQRYATSAVSAYFFRALAEAAEGGPLPVSPTFLPLCVGLRTVA